MEFKNKENPQHTLESGRVLFESRSVAVMAMVLAKSQGDYYALVSQRGPAVTETGKWNMVCGYLDWDEALHEAVTREVYEEAGIDLFYVTTTLGFVRLNTQPDYIHSAPSTVSQNVTARFVVTLPSPVLAHTRNAHEDEVLDSLWIKLTAEELDAKEWAFNHKELLSDFLTFIEGNGKYHRNPHNDISRDVEVFVRGWKDV